jgi:ATP-dependent Clp protease ATP-binding subunit ClpA
VPVDLALFEDFFRLAFTGSFLFGQLRCMASVDATNPPPSPVALLEFGRVLQTESQRSAAGRNPTQLQEIEDQLIQRLSTEKNSLLKPALNFNAAKPIDPSALRVLAVVAYRQLCKNRLVVTVGDVVQAVAGDDPAKVLETRRTVSQLLIAKQLVLQSDASACLALGEGILNFLAGGKEATPLMLTESQLAQRWRKAEELAAKSRAKVVVDNLPSPKQLAARISKHVVGLDAQVRTLACRLVMHQRRAALLKAHQDPGSPNEALLFVGPSGTGKTFLAEIASKACGLP